MSEPHIMYSQTDGCEIVGCQWKHGEDPMTPTPAFFITQHIVNSLLFRYTPFLQVLSQQRLYKYIQVEKLFVQK